HAFGGGLDQAELALAQHGCDRRRHGRVVERIGQVVARGGLPYISGHVHADEQSLLDLALPFMDADDRLDAQVTGGHVVGHGTEASHCSTSAMCTVAQDLATSGSCA